MHHSLHCPRMHCVGVEALLITNLQVNNYIYCTDIGNSAACSVAIKNRHYSH